MFYNLLLPQLQSVECSLEIHILYLPGTHMLELITFKLTIASRTSSAMFFVLAGGMLFVAQSFGRLNNPH